jgi:hypothetical protein
MNELASGCVKRMTGAVWLTATAKLAEAALVPIEFVSVAVSVWLPSANFVLVVMSKVPLAATVPVPTPDVPPSA